MTPASGARGGGTTGVRREYQAALRSWLARHKEYPSAARLRRHQGTALLYFVIDREGRVLEYRLEDSSGYELLDREVLAMIERAGRLPRIPEELDQARLELVVPVEFSLR